MTVIFSEHLDGTNGASLVPGTNTTYNQVGTASGTTVAFDTSTSAAGASSAKFVQTTSFGSAALFTTPFTSATTMYRRMCFRLGVLPNGNLYISEALTSTGSFASRLAVNSASHLFLQDGTTTVATGTTTLAINTWYRVEWDMVGTTHVVRLYGSPTSTTVLETLTVTTMTGTAFVRFEDGIAASGNSNLVTMWLDEVVNDTTTPPGTVGGVGASSTGSLGFTGASVSALGARSSGSLGFSGSSQPLSAGGKIAGLVDTFTGTVVDQSKWHTSNGARQSDGAILPSGSPTPAFTSAQVWDATGSVIFVGINPPPAGQGDLQLNLVKNGDPTKYLRVSVASNTLTVTLLDGGADAGVVSRAVTNRDNVVRVTEASGTITVAVRERNSPTWVTLRTLTAPAWWNAVLVVLASANGTVSGASAVFTNVNTLVASPTGHQLSSTLTDDFTGTSLVPTRWTVAGPGVITVNNDVEMAAVSTAKTQVTSVDSFQLDTANLQVRAAIGNSADLTTFKLLSPVTGTEARFSLTAGTLSAEYRVADIADSYTLSVAHDNSQPVYLQFSADIPNNNLVWSYSFDGINYAVLRTSPLPAWYTGAQIAFASKAA